MGYRSQVRCIIYGAKDNLEAYILEKALIEGDLVFSDFKEALTRYTAKIQHYGLNGPEEEIVHVLDLYGDGWKWYEQYDDVQKWKLFMEESVDNDLNYEFVRVGEEDADVETRSSYDAVGLLGVSTVITEDISKVDVLPLLFK